MLSIRMTFEPPLTSEELEILRRIAEEARAFRCTAPLPPAPVEAVGPLASVEPVRRYRCATFLPIVKSAPRTFVGVGN